MEVEMQRLWTPWRMAYIKQDSKKLGCIFCEKVKAGDDRKEHILWRGKLAYITLNLYPYNNGHLMVVPYQHSPSLESLPPETICEIGELINFSLRLLRGALSPDGFNIGINIGKFAGAGVEEHVHVHVVPRWSGDTNFMTVSAETRVIPDWIDDTYDTLKRFMEEHPEILPR
jgi:ATP adenylyltransferase